MKKSKKYIVIIIIIFLLAILGFLIAVSVNKKEEEKDYFNDFKMIGGEVYSIYYYDIISMNKSQEELNDYLQRFEKKGLSFSLVDLENYSLRYNKKDYINLINEFVNNNRECTKETTMVVIYPNSPFRNQDFTSEIKTQCNYGK